ncbi:cation:proton antiporter [Methylibium sp.]|uniref:cation:proton antiporter n=1 Tax=Methylibium sp. TaxID=2067992 RepID=UPI0018337637|nr:cation:proton antiporter [Methylibium sp.]MBA3591706.1 cation:proton antiporter [Methylibium sp.]
MLANIAGYLQIQPWPPEPGLLFWSALTLIAGGLIGEVVFRRLALPRIVGYSAVGLVIALSGNGLEAGQMGGGARLIVDLALGLLLFELGSRVNLRWLRANPALLWTSAAESLLSFAAIFFTLRWLGLDTKVALACATMTVSASAAVVGRVASELKSAGQVTERMIVLTALNTLYAVLSHRLVLGWLHLDAAGEWVQGVAQPIYTFAGSVLLAVALARLVAWVARRLELRDENSVLLLLGLIVLAMTTAQLLNLSTLLVPLAAGVLLRNTTERPWVWPRHFGTAGGVLVLMLFVIVGASWSLEALALGGVAALLLLLARGAAKALVVVGMASWSGIRTRQGVALALTLTPVSGTTLVLYADLHVTHPAFAMTVAPIVLSAIAIMELLGPIAVQLGLRLAGEHQPRRRAAAQEIK